VLSCSVRRFILVPCFFLVLASVLAALIALEIAITADSRHVPSVLFKIIVLGILIRASAYFEFPSAISVDPYYHVGFIQFVLDHGYIPAHAVPYNLLEYPSLPIFQHVGRGVIVSHRTQRV